MKTAERIGVVVVAILLAAILYYGVRDGKGAAEAKRWKAAADSSRAANDSLLESAAAWARAQATIGGELAAAIAAGDAERSEAARLRGVIAVLVDGVSSPPPVVPGCERWIEHAEDLSALVDTLRRAGAVDSGRAARAEIGFWRADSARRDAVGRVITLTRRLEVADSLLEHAPKIPTRPRLEAFVGGRVRTGRTGEALVGLRSHGWHVAGGIDQDRRRLLEVGWTGAGKVF